MEFNNLAQFLACLRFRDEGLGVRAYGLWFRVQGVGRRVRVVVGVRV